jgi:hypothetical protein
LVGPQFKHDDKIIFVVFNRDGSRLATSSYDYTARVWDVQSGAAVTPPMKHNHWVHGVAFSPDGCRLATASHDKTVRLWDAATGEPVGEPLVHDACAERVRFSPDSQLLEQLDARNAENYLNRGLAYQMKGDFDQAVADFTVALRPNTCGHGAVWATPIACGAAISWRSLKTPRRCGSIPRMPWLTTIGESPRRASSTGT